VVGVGVEPRADLAGAAGLELDNGVAVDERLRPLDEDGAVVYDNLHAVGAALAGAEPWREKSGEGLALASGYRAAQAILEELA
jgi:glycerol-3-phosphate dehydrogenase subunit B